MLFCSLLCAYLLTPTLTPGTSQPITFTGHAAPLYRLLPELSEAAGVKLEASAKMADTVMIVKVDKVPLNDLMKRIADASTGEWEKTDEGYKLNLSASKAKQEQQAEDNALAIEIEGAVKKQIVERDKKEPGDNPLSTNVDDFIRAIGPNSLAGLRSGASVTYCNKPNRLQMQLPASAMALVPSFIEGYRKCLAEDQETDLVYLVLTRLKFSDSFVVGLFVCGSKLSPSMSIPMFFVTEAKLDQKFKLSLPSSEFKLSEDDQRLASVFASKGGVHGVDIVCNNHFPGSSDQDRQYRSVETSVLGRVLSCDQAEPLAPYAGAAVEWLAEDQNLIAVLPDSAFVKSIRLFSNWKGSAEALLKSMGEDWGLKYDRSDSWLTVTPERPLLARNYRVNRRAFATALRKASVQGLMSLDE